jgi:hypothetical protein
MEVYRGYRIRLEPRQDGLRVYVSPIYPQLPILSRAHFDWSGTEHEAVKEARRRVDVLLSG